MSTLNRVCTALREYGFGTQRVVPSLDGLRAVSILFVLGGHLTGTRHFLSSLPWGGPLGEFGVRVFFVISGYLITSILLNEFARKGGVALSRFYLRRALRLFPAAYFLIAVVAVLAAKRFVRLERWDLEFALTYTMNFHQLRAWSLGHLWSLAVEEQFYLVWPVTLTMLGPSRSVRFLCGVLAVAPLLRQFIPYVGPAFNFAIWSDALATGCLLAILREPLSANRTYSCLLASRWFFLVPVAALAANIVPFTRIYWLVSETIMNVAIAASIDWAMRNSTSAVGRFLNQPTVSFMGVLSYSLYLWQQLFLNRYSNSTFCAFPLNIILALAAALASYLLIEAPILRMRAAFEAARPQRQQVKAEILTQ
jgi:peptidoglycan/LPS O-acetylase OafA/YrhL